MRVIWVFLMLLVSISLAEAQVGWTNNILRPTIPMGYNQPYAVAAIALDTNDNVFVTGGMYQTNGQKWFDYATMKISYSGVPLWTNYYNGPANSNDCAVALAVDTNGNVIVTGYSAGLTATNEFATIKYSNDGIPLWTNRFNASNLFTNTPINVDCIPCGVAVDSVGSVYVAGTFSWERYPGDSSLTRSVVIKYSSTGMPVWTNSDPVYNEQALAMALDDNANVFITGNSGAQFLTLAYSSSGMPLWTNYFRSLQGATNLANAIATDETGDVFVTGFTMLGRPNYVTIKYSAAGVPVWTNFFRRSPISSDVANAIAVDSAGEVVVAGQSMTNTYYQWNANVAVTIKYSAAGVALWTNFSTAPGFVNFQPLAMALDWVGNIYLTGSGVGPSLYSNIYTAKISGAGAFVWANTFRSENGASGDAIAVDSGGTAFPAGESIGNDSTHLLVIEYPATLSIGNFAAGFTNGAFAFALTGPTGSNAVIQASSDLQSWQPVVTNTFVQSRAFFVDPRPPSLTQQFYRALQP